jgi:hypothetical protein
MKRVNIPTMKQGLGELVELYLENELRGGRLLCPHSLIPAPGQYLLAQGPASDSPLPAPVFNAGSIPGGFLAAPPVPQTWQPGTTLSLRGPLGRGFSLPISARRVALVVLGETPARLRPLLTASLEQSAALVLVSDLDLPDLPPEVEIQPVSALAEVAQWADYLAIDIVRESLPGCVRRWGLANKPSPRSPALTSPVGPGMRRPFRLGGLPARTRYWLSRPCPVAGWPNVAPALSPPVAVGKWPVKTVPCLI